LAERIAELKKGPKRGESTELVRAMGLVISFGFIFIINVYLGFLLGSWLHRKTGNILHMALGLFIGVGFGACAAYAALKPFIKNIK
jgi:hypothetical protein